MVKRIWKNRQTQDPINNELLINKKCNFLYAGAGNRNLRLFDIANDPTESTEVSTLYPEVRL